MHSTGQLHKGDANNALFPQFTVDLLRDLRISGQASSPESFITFGVLKKAQEALDDG